jgi:serine protease AprX
MKVHFALSVFIALIVSSGSFASQTPHPKISSWLWKSMTQVELSTTENSFDGEALVYLKKQADVSQLALTGSKTERGRAVHALLVKTALDSQQELRAWLNERSVDFTPHWITNMIVVRGGTPSLIQEIASRDDVLRVVGNPKFRQFVPSSGIHEFMEQPSTIGPNLSRIGADKVWAELGVNGSGIVIAGQDTGVEWEHPGLKPHYRGWNGTSANHDYNWYDAIEKPIAGGSSCGYNKSEPCDDHDHGTHTVGTMVGDDNVGNQVGVAPGSKWIACRNMDDGLGRPSTYISCFEFFLAPWKIGGDRFKDGDPAQAPHVMNNSWGCPKDEGCEGGEFEGPLRALEAAGIFVVVSAGNSGPNCSTIMDGPAFNTSLVFSVGAMNHRDDTIASFSSRGPSTFDNLVGPHIAAPGVSIRSTVRGGRYASAMWSGTSMAGPHAAGLIALLWSAQPELIGNVQKTRDLVMSTSENKTQANQTCGGVSGSSIPNNTWGYGIINAYNAVKAAKNLK